MFCLFSTIYAWPRYGFQGAYYSIYHPTTSYGYHSSVSSPYVAPVTYSHSAHSAKSPSAEAALAFLNTLPLDTCGKQAKAFIEDILAGGSASSATAKATAVYQADYANYAVGTKASPNPACLAAENAWKQAHASGQDPVLASALSYMKSYKSESPCAVSAFDYVQSIVNGRTHAEANVAAMKSFIAQVKNLAAAGKPTVDPLCAKSALAYASSTGSSTPNAEAMRAFIAKALETGNGLDPVCLAAAEDVIEGKSNYAAAKIFVKLYKNNPTPAAQSPCAAAAKAYSSAVKSSSTPSTQAAMISFIDDAVATNSNGLSPACEAAAEAYFAAFDTGATEAVANAAAGKAFLAIVQQNPSLAYDSSCAQAAKAFMNVSG